ncbi:50S ribosomal protein L11 methyltransferase [Marinilabilia rubra]|uniref:Ribosomal protein L11 methyltransferase n=1 Tax=Marinilabilia rubra TaxID=2162893 RepID=A0A2U2B6Q4_9BACT|nr:50S ribosomal protein L11 methyltransferase [Marinilabilia rubra]PWD98722.1 50S ribosomal protein L11 methyltransferase [Marinilabilia rubra]
MTYKKINIKIAPATEASKEIFIALLSELGYESFLESQEGLEAYILEDLYRPLDENNLPILNSPEFTAEISVEDLEEKNWNEEWEKNYFKPILIGNECLVRSSFHEKPSQAPKYEILINPKMSFGTGYHETTSLMIQFILEREVDGQQILDMGCGTGILGILASMKGAKQVLGIDIDQWARENAIENLQLNHINNMDIKLGDASLLREMPEFDTILANINRNILLEDMPRYNEVAKKGATIIMSGFYEEDFDKINKKALSLNWEHLSVKEQNKWVALSYRKK